MTIVAVNVFMGCLHQLVEPFIDSRRTMNAKIALCVSDITRKVDSWWQVSSLFEYCKSSMIAL